MILDHEGDTMPGKCGVDGQIDVVEDQLPFDLHLQLAAILFEFPDVQAARTDEAQIYAAVLSEVTRHLRRTMSGKIIG